MYATTNRIMVVKLRMALKVGRLETSTFPSIPSGRGPRIRYPTAKAMTAERMYIILSQNWSPRTVSDVMVLPPRVIQHHATVVAFPQALN